MQPTATEWRWIPGFPGYEVSTVGTVRSYWVTRAGVRAALPQKEIKQFVSSWGYWRVCIKRLDGRMVTRGVHQFVALAYHGDPNGRQVNHVDGDKQNNALTNLEYVSPAENMRHASRVGLLRNRPIQRGSAHPAAILTETTVREMRLVASSGALTYVQIGKRFGVSDRTARKAVIGETWTHVEGAVRNQIRRH